MEYSAHSGSSVTALDLPVGEERRPLSPFANYTGRRRWSPLRNPWTLQRFMALEILRVMVLGVLAISVLYLAVVAYQTVRGGVQLSLIWPFLIKIFAYPLYYSLPLALLFGVTLTLGRMVGDLEVAAMRCHGASHLQIYFPVLTLAVLVSVVAYLVNGWVVPRLRYERRNLQQYVVRQLENLGAGVNRTILLPDGGGSLKVGAYDGTELRKVHIDLYRNLQSRFVPAIRDKLPEKLPSKVTVLAREGKLQITERHDGIIVHLRGVELLIPETITGTPTGSDKFHHKFAITESLAIPLTFAKKKPSTKDLTSPDLAARVDTLRSELSLDPDNSGLRRSLNKARSEWHRRLAFAISAITFPLIGISLCLLLNHRSRLVPFFAGNVTVLALFYPLLMVGSSLGERGLFPALSLALPNLVLLAAGVYLTRKVLVE